MNSYNIHQFSYHTHSAGNTTTYKYKIGHYGTYLNAEGYSTFNIQIKIIYYSSLLSVLAELKSRIFLRTIGK